MNRKRIELRWFVLLLFAFSVLMIGFFYNFLSPLKKELSDLLMANSYDYSFIVASASLPGLVLLIGLLGGIFIDKFGPYITLIVFGFIMLFGAFITAFSISEYFQSSKYLFSFFDSFWNTCHPSVKFMALGFFIYGLGALVIIVSLDRIITYWFQNDKIATALTIRSSSLRFGEASALLLSPILFVNFGWNAPMWFSFGLVATSFILLMTYLLFFEKKLSSQLTPSKENKFKLAVLKTLFSKKEFLMLIFFQLILYASFYPLIFFGPDLLRNRYTYSLVEAGIHFASLIILIGLISPIFGMLIDKGFEIGKLLLIGCLFCFVGSSLFLWKAVGSIFPMFFLAIGVAALISCVQTLIPKLIKSELRGTAFGALGTASYIGSYLMTLLIGFILKTFNSDDYQIDSVSDALNYEPILILISSSTFILLILAYIFRKMLKKAVVPQ